MLNKIKLLFHVYQTKIIILMKNKKILVVKFFDLNEYKKLMKGN